MVEIKHELSIGAFTLMLLLKRTHYADRSKLSYLPLLAFVLAQILNCKRLDAWNRQQSLPSCVNCESAQIARNPAATQFLRDGCGCTRTTKAIEDKIVFIG